MRRLLGSAWMLAVALACASPDAPPAAQQASTAPASAEAPPEAPAVREGSGPEQPAPDPSPEGGAAAPLPPLNQQERELGLTFQPLADEFGLSEYVRAWRTAGGRGLAFEYLPEGQTVADWEYRGRFEITRVAESWEQGVEILPRFVEAFVRQQQQLNEAGTWTFPEGDVSFVDYEGTRDGLREHSLAAIWQVLPGHVAVFQIERRSSRFEDWQIDRFKEVASRLGRADAGGEAPGEASP